MNLETWKQSLLFFNERRFEECNELLQDSNNLANLTRIAILKLKCKALSHLGRFNEAYEFSQNIQSLDDFSAVLQFLKLRIICGSRNFTHESKKHQLVMLIRNYGAITKMLYRS
jgi:two-component SAPR family response regulator